jgi:hypothetical protein
LTEVHTPPWVEAIQLVPILTLAFPFILAGKVDIAHAGTSFMGAGLMSILLFAFTLRRGYLLNPILTGTNLWLCFGAVAYAFSVNSFVSWLVATQAFGLFVAVFVVGLVTTAFSRYGFVACLCNDPIALRRSSLTLLAFVALAVVWAWLFRHQVRLGGGLPFICINVARRVLGRRISTLPHTAA